MILKIAAVSNRSSQILNTLPETLRRVQSEMTSFEDPSQFQSWVEENDPPHLTLIDLSIEGAETAYQWLRERLPESEVLIFGSHSEINPHLSLFSRGATSLAYIEGDRQIDQLSFEYAVFSSLERLKLKIEKKKEAAAAPPEVTTPPLAEDCSLKRIHSNFQELNGVWNPLEFVKKWLDQVAWILPEGGKAIFYRLDHVKTWALTPVGDFHQGKVFSLPPFEDLPRMQQQLRELGSEETFREFVRSEIECDVFEVIPLPAQFMRSQRPYLGYIVIFGVGKMDSARNTELSVLNSHASLTLELLLLSNRFTQMSRRDANSGALSENVFIDSIKKVREGHLIFFRVRGLTRLSETQGFARTSSILKNSLLAAEKLLETPMIASLGRGVFVALVESKQKKAVETKAEALKGFLPHPDVGFMTYMSSFVQSKNEPHWIEKKLHEGLRALYQ